MSAEIVNPHALKWRPVRPVEDGPSFQPAIETSISDAEAAELRRLAQGKRVVEIGTAFAYSAILMAKTGAKQVVTCDPHQWLGSLEEAKRNVKAWDVENRVRLLVGRSDDVLAHFGDRSFDLAFIDGDHAAAAVQTDVAIAKRLIRHRGYIAAHDYGEVSCPGVREALDFTWPSGPCRLVDTLYIRRAG